MIQKTNPSNEMRQFLTSNMGMANCKFESTTDAVTVACEFTSIERLGCSFNELNCRINSGKELSEEQIERISDELCKTLSYLEEPIRRIEFDRSERFAMMRSDPPERDESATRYYELNVTSNLIQLSRFEKATEKRHRQKIACVVTQHIMSRLVGDMVLTVAEST